MTIKRMILRYRGSGDPPPVSSQLIRSAPGVQIIDESPRMVLVALPEENIASLAERLPEWSLTEERTYGLPEPKPGLRLKRKARVRDP